MVEFIVAHGFPSALALSRCKSYVVRCVLKVEILSVRGNHGVLVELAVGSVELIKCDSWLSFPQHIDSESNEGMDAERSGCVNGRNSKETLSGFNAGFVVIYNCYR